MNDKSVQFIKSMKAHAAREAREADRCRKQWRRLACVAFIAGSASLCFAALVSGWTLKIVIISLGLAWIVAGRATWKQGDLFALKWLELREQALRYAKEEEDRL